MGGSLIISLHPFLPTNPTPSSKSQSPHHTFQGPAWPPCQTHFLSCPGTCGSGHMGLSALPLTCQAWSCLRAFAHPPCLTHSRPPFIKLMPSLSSCLYSKVTSRDFSDGPVVKTLHASRLRSAYLIPDQRIRSTFHTAQLEDKKKMFRNKKYSPITKS